MRYYFKEVVRRKIVLIVIFLFCISKIGHGSDSLKVAATSNALNSSQFITAIIPFEISENDSLLISSRQNISDSLQVFLASPLFSAIPAQILEDESIAKLTPGNEGELKQFADKNNINLMIFGKLEFDANHSIYFRPSFLINESAQAENKDFAADNSLTGKTCRLNQIHLPKISPDELESFFNFIAVNYFLSQKNFDETIRILITDSTFAGRFFLAESYLRRGISHDKNLTSAKKDWDSSLVALKMCSLLAESSLDSICVYNNSGVAFQLLGKLDSAIVCFTKAMSNFRQSVSSRERIKIANNLGNIYLLSGQWKQALDVFQSNLEEVKNSGDSLNLAETYENLGDIYQLILQRNKAIQYYTSALEIRKSMNDDAGMATCFQLLGNVYLGKNEHETAKRHFKEGLALNLKLQNEPRVADSYDLIGQVFQDAGVADSALIYYQKSMSNYELLGDEIGYLRSLLHQASVHQKEKKFDEALALYNKALERTTDQDSRNMQAQIYDRLGDIYNSRDDLITAYDYYKQSTELYEELQNYESLSLILFNMGLIHLKNNEYGEGYQILKRAIEMDKEHGFNNLSNEQDFLQEVQDLLNKN
ncbi:tetratricopeptide repeat protein [candidate division KSB1 bacterium]|nr:tetratricopeptide repeat protein [candidate division KSB1 bacterium]